MLVKLPTHDNTLLNSFGRSHATVNAAMPPLIAAAPTSDGTVSRPEPDADTVLVSAHD
jgi:hypothetical protein